MAGAEASSSNSKDKQEAILAISESDQDLCFEANSLGSDPMFLLEQRDYIVSLAAQFYTAASDTETRPRELETLREQLKEGIELLRVAKSNLEGTRIKLMVKDQRYRGLFTVVRKHACRPQICGLTKKRKICGRGSVR